MEPESPNQCPIILASQSPRRAQLLRGAGIAFEAVHPEGDEPSIVGWLGSPAAFAESASLFKARSIADRHPDRVILAADTIVAVGNHIFGKATDAADARRILGTLAGVTQQVITGVTLLAPAAGRQLTRHDITDVTMRRMSSAELDAYIASGEWEGKAGAYAIQETADRFVERVEGSWTNVVGLPIELVIEMLADFGITTRR